MLTIVADLEVFLEAAPFGHLGLELQKPVSIMAIISGNKSDCRWPFVQTGVLYLQTPPLLIQLAGDDSFVKALSDDEVFKLSNTADS